MRVGGNRIRKEKVSDVKIFGYVLKGPESPSTRIRIHMNP